jgi:deoxycytidine triphosphate deaminase
VDTDYFHQIISDPSAPRAVWKEEFEGNAVVLHIGEYRGKVSESGKDLIIPPGRFLFFMTQEIVDLPFDVDGNLFMNPRISNLGLQFFTLGHVDPGFHGFLTATILNTTDREIILDRHDGVLYFVLAKMDSPMAPNFKQDFHSIPQDTLRKAEANLSYNMATAFALTSESFVTRKELYGYVILVLTLFATVFAILQYFASNPKPFF